MITVSQLFMQYKISESYCVFNGEYHEYIKMSKIKKKTQKIKYIS